MKTVIAASILIGVGWAIGGEAFAARFKGNIPKSRLDDNSYTNWDGGFELTPPPLITPGAKAEERQIGPAEKAVVFVDDFGSMYYVIRTDNTDSKRDLETVAAGYTLNESLREKTIVSTARGSELRLAGVVPGPMVKETRANGKITQKTLDSHRATSLFIAGSYIYEVMAGVTATHGESDAEMFAIAKKKLDAFLGGLRIMAPSPSER